MDNDAHRLKIRFHSLFSFLVIINLFLAEVVRTFSPVYVTVTLSVFLALFLLYITLKYISTFKLTCFLGCISILNIFAYYLLTGTIELGYFYLFVMILVGFILKDDIENYKKYFKLIVVFNLIFLIRERIYDEYLIDSYHIGLSAYGQGLFSYAKNTGDALSFLAIIFRSNHFWMVLLIISSILTGVRSAIIFVSVIFVIDILLTMPRFSLSLMKGKINYRMLAGIIIGILFFISTAYLFFVNTHNLPIKRLYSLLLLGSATYAVRGEMWMKHIDEIIELPIFNLLFGAGTYVPQVVGNGAENLYLQLLPQHGLIFFAFLTILFSLTVRNALKSFTNFKKYYPIFLVLMLFMFVRSSLTWLGGIILWAWIFSIIVKKKKRPLARLEPRNG